MTNSPAVINIIPEPTVQNQVIVTVEGQDWIRDLGVFGLSFEATEREVLSAITPAIREEFGVDISNHYKVRKATNSRNVYVIPASTAGSV